MFGPSRKAEAEGRVKWNISQLKTTPPKTQITWVHRQNIVDQITSIKLSPSKCLLLIQGGGNYKIRGEEPSWQENKVTVKLALATATARSQKCISRSSIYNKLRENYELIGDSSSKSLNGSWVRKIVGAHISNKNRIHNNGCAWHWHSAVLNHKSRKINEIIWSS